MEANGNAGSTIGMSLQTRRGLVEEAQAKGLWMAEFFRGTKSGKRKQIDEDLFPNIIVNAGRDHLLDVTLSAATQDTTWFVGLTDGTPTVAATDVEGTHAGWVEVTAYTEANRVAWSDGGVSSQSVDNSASPATFSINATTTVGGSFLSGDNTKGDASPAVAVLYAVGAFTGGDRSLQNNDSIDVTATFTMSG